MVFQQRNGRVDRYGQKHQPEIVYLFTETVTDRIRGDLRILEILQAKDEQAYLNLGDPSAFLNVYDPEKEAEKVSDFMAQGMAPEAVEAKLEQAAADESDNGVDWLMQLFGGGDAAATAPEPAAPSSVQQINEPASLFDGDYHYAKTALTQLNQGQTLCQWTPHDGEKVIALTAPRDLQDRLKQLPREVQADNDHYSLCADPKRMAAAIETARQARREQDTWPQLHYLWPQHPIMEWLGDRVLTHFGRHTAPLLQSQKLAPNEQAFILMSLVPNRKGQPLLVEWQVASRVGQGAFQLEDFDAFIARAGIRAGALPNRGYTDGLAALQGLKRLTKPCHRKSSEERLVMHESKQEKRDKRSTVQEGCAAVAGSRRLGQGRSPAGERRDGPQRHPVRFAHRHPLGRVAPGTGLWQRHDLLAAST
ncbi:hypothetical protein SAMN04489710_102386 [Paracidovorax konjaci]|uniref:Uncharacterized protein n=1 Tax=Paracidovorax konjaci TaxID=32040 RepID=A0A1I1SXR2_9BURK|nr:hypothetical protein SAMN04489710_102386 [Paracidovorax konjaci]